MLASVPGDLSLEMRDRFRGLGDMVGGGFTLPLATVATEMWYAPAYRAAHPELPAETLALLRRNDPAAQRACCMALAGEEDLRGRLGGLGIPVTFLFGRQDGVAPRSAAGHLVEETRGTVVELDTGHFPQDEDPHGFSDALLAFLEAVDRMAPASPA
jgi:3-oxoadipate enol-lactonase